MVAQAATEVAAITGPDAQPQVVAISGAILRIRSVLRFVQENAACDQRPCHFTAQVM